MASNSFGSVFRFTTWGESHGQAIGVVIDGVPSGLPLTAQDIQPDLDRRRPGGSRYTSQRRESDRLRLLSGVFEGYTTGAPISLIIDNHDTRPQDYQPETFRPSHADYTYWKKYAIRDHRGGGRSSARETASRVAAGAVARKLISYQGIKVRGALTQLGKLELDIDRRHWDWDAVCENPFFCPDRNSVSKWADYLEAIRKRGQSVGAVVEVQALGVPPGLGEPIYGKLDSDLARALMGINAVKGVEIGAGFAAAGWEGSANADEIRIGDDGKVCFLSNHAGGILGGISTGEDIIVRFAVKPTSSIRRALRTTDIHGKERLIVTRGRHDPCVGIRAVPVGEAMVACVIADHLLRARLARLVAQEPAMEGPP